MRADVSRGGRRRGDDRLRRARSSARCTCCSTTPASFPDEDGSVVDTDEAVFDRVIAVNLKGVFLGCKYGIPALLRAGGGSIINTASFVAVMGAATVAERLHGVEGRRAGADARDRRRVRPPRHPRQRAVPGAGQHAAAPALLADPARARGASSTCRWAASRKRTRSPRRAVPGLGRVVLRQRTTFLVDGGTTAAYVTAE